MALATNETMKIEKITSTTTRTIKIPVYLKIY